MIINYNITDFDQIEWNGLPFGDDSVRNIEQEIALIKFDNSYQTIITKSYFPEPTDIKLYDIVITNPNSDETIYKRLFPTEVSNKLLEIQNL